MNLLFDLKATQPNISGKRHGGGKYAEVIFFRMVEKKMYFSCFYDSSLWLNPNIKSLCTQNDIPLYDIKSENVETIVKKYSIDRLYSAIPGQLALLRCCEVVGTVHGLREFETPFDNIFFQYKSSPKEFVKFVLKRCFSNWFHERKYREYLKYYINSPFKLITVSEHSKYAFLSFFPELKNKEFKVFYSPNTSSCEELIRNTSEKYFLLVSGNRWEKNNLRAIQAFDRLISNNLITDVKIKITGCDGSHFRYKIKNPDYFEFLGYVDDHKLEELYANAYLFIYPSLNEGFGYPPLEAMRYKIPVIASPFSSIAEICSQGVLFFNPYSVEEIMNRMLMMMDEQRHAEYSERGYEQYLKIRERQDKDLDSLIEYISQ